MRAAAFVSVLSLAIAGKPRAAEPLTIWVNSQSDEKYYKNMVRDFRKKVDPEFEADIQAYGFTEMPDKLAVAVKTGINTPDIVQIDELYFSLYLQGTSPFLDITDRVREAGFLQSIPSERMDLFRFQGKIYGLPQSLGAVVLYYRKDVFDELKISERDIDTWDKAIEVGKKFLGEQRGMLALDWSYFEILLRQRGYTLFDEAGNSLLTQPAAVHTLQWLVDLNEMQIGREPDRGSIYEPVFFSGDVASGEIAMVMGADWYGLDMLREYTPEEIRGLWRIMPLPAWTDTLSRSRRTTSTFSGQGLVIFKKSKRTDEAWKFIKWVMEDPDANAERYLQGNCVPAFRPAWLDTRLSQPMEMFGGQSLGSVLLDLTNQLPPMRQSPYRAQAMNLLREKYWHSLMSKSITPRDALREIEAALGKPSAGQKP